MPDNLSIPVPNSPDGPVFSKVIKTLTGKNGYETDKAEASFKALEANEMTSEAALATVPTGVDQTNIRGQSVFHSDGNRIDLIDGSETLVRHGYGGFGRARRRRRYACRRCRVSAL